MTPLHLLNLRLFDGRGPIVRVGQTSQNLPLDIGRCAHDVSALQEPGTPSKVAALAACFFDNQCSSSNIPRTQAVFPESVENPLRSPTKV